MARTPTLPAARHDDAVTPIELFFDLVFVFALTQVTASMAEGADAGALGRGVLLVGLLWWSWTGYAWLGNLVHADEGLMRVGVFTAMAGNFVLALALPEAFDDRPGGLSGPWIVAISYFVVRAVHIALFLLLSGDDVGLRRQVQRFAVSMVVATGLLFVAAASSPAERPVWWALALLADYGGTWIGGASGWRVRSAAHFAERHGLIVIVALGESVIAIGFGVAALPVSWPIVVASLLGLVLSGALWWVYFDATARLAEHALAHVCDDHRAALARDAYSFLHLPMVVGIVLIALGMKKVLEYVGDDSAHQLTDPLSTVPLVALGGGVVLYLLAHVAFKLRALRVVSIPRLSAAALVVLITVLGARLPALVTLASTAAGVVALVVYERIHYGPRPVLPAAG